METESSVMMDLEALLRDRQKHHYQQWGILPGDLERDYHSLNRSGSAPPTVEGSRRAVGSLLGGAAMGEEEAPAQPAYRSHYYSSENRNPRLPPVAVSREDWRAVARRGRAGSLGGFGDQSTAVAGQPGPAAAMRQAAPVQLGRGAAGAINELGTRRSFADVLQGDFNRSTSISGHLSCPGNHNAYETVVDPMRVSDAQLTCHGGLDTIDMHSVETSSDLARVQSLGSSMSHPFATTHGSSLSRNATPDSQLSERSPSPYLPPIGERMDDIHNIIASNGFGAVSSCVADCGDISDAFSCLSLSKNVFANGEDYVQGLFDHELANSRELSFSMSGDQHQYLQQKISRESRPDPFNTSTIPMLAYDQFLRRNGVLTDTDSKLTPSGEFTSLKQTPSTNLYNKAVSMGSNTSASTTYYQNADLANVDFARHNLDTYSANRRLPTMLSRQLDSGGAYPSRTGNWVGSEAVMDPLYAQYLLRGAESSAFAADNLSDLSLCGSYLGASDMDLPGYQKAHLRALLAQQKLQYDKAFLSKYGGSNHGFNGHPSFGLGMPYRTSPGSVLSSLSRGSPLRQSEPLSCSPFTMSSSMEGSMRSWNHENGIMENIIASSLLEELKNNKARSFELSDIVDHVVEFSVDQYGSRFIQQKLETTSLEEKNKIFHKILPHVRALMTDVFGNYVIQKFFEHGTESQREQLASQLLGHVLPLSLQMYGCRVIQKALEVVDVDQQSQMVLELDGSIMKCVRDQNGNHVIQKCIECVPQDRIQFIISAFYGQVVALSTHPYGCRVIQRVLEHCDDVDTQQIMMDEIMESVCTLAQDQYGNYVIQHVLQHGKQDERSVIINKLSGQIVKMSQQKFASNVIEKCLTYGTPAECQRVIDEILGSTDENEPLQAMMKHQFGNYVVQKLLETCDDQNRELILSRIKVHLDTLKRYTYGKHIVARVEKLIATGERCSGISSYS